MEKIKKMFWKKMILAIRLALFIGMLTIWILVWSISIFIMLALLHVALPISDEQVNMLLLISGLSIGLAVSYICFRWKRINIIKFFYTGDEGDK